MESETFIYADTYSLLNLGCMLNWGLYGALCAQVYLYYLAFPEDRTLNKVLVYGVYLLETLQAFLLLFDIIYMSRSLVVLSTSTYVDQPSLTALPALPVSVLQNNTIYDVLWVAISLSGGLVTLVVQSFYAYRLHILTRSWIIAPFIMLFALMQFVMTLIGGTLLFPVSFSLNFNTVAWARLPFVISVFSWGGLSIINDIIIAIYMTYFLLQNDSDWKSTHTLLVKLVRLTVETGTATVIVSVIFLALWFLTGIADYCMPALSVLGKVYSNAMMVNFNHRIHINNGRNETQTTPSTMLPFGTDCTVPENAETRRMPAE